MRLEKGPSFVIVDVQGNPVSVLRAGLGWDPASAQPDNKGGRFGKIKRAARKVVQGEPKSDLDNSVVFFSGTTTIRVANGSNRFPWQRSTTDLGPVRSSADSTGGEGFGLDEWTDIYFDDLNPAVDGFAVVASTFDKGNFSTARNVTGSLFNVLNPGTPQEQLVEVGAEFYPEISDPTLNVSIGGFGKRGRDGSWKFTQVSYQGSIAPSDDVNVANQRIMAFAKEHLGDLMRAA